MNLQRILASVGLCAVIGLVGCDSGETKKEPEKKVEAKPEEKKAPEAKPEEKKAPEAKVEAPADAKVPTDAAGTPPADAKAPDAAGTPPADAKAPTDPPPDAKAADDKKGAEKKAPEKKAEDKAPAIDGKPLYEAKCKSCHALDGKGTEAMKKKNIPDMTAKDWQSKHSKASVVKAITDGVDGTQMKSFKEKLTKDEIDAVAAYVKKMK